MATQRYISTTFWDDEWVADLESHEKLFYIYLLTNPLTDISGIYKISDKRIAFDTGIDRSAISAMWKRFETKLQRDGEWLIILSWPNHQKWKQRSKIQTGIENSLLRLPKPLFDKLSSIGYAYPMDTLSYPLIPYAYDPNYLDIDSELDRDSEKEKNSLVPAKTPEPEKPDKITDVHLALAKKLAVKIEINDPNRFSGKNRTATVRKWADDIRLLIDADKRDIETIQKVIDWSQKDSFWRTNILSASKLRKQFPQLLLKMNEKSGRNGDGPRDGPEEWETADPDKYYGKSTFKEV